MWGESDGWNGEGEEAGIFFMIIMQNGMPEREKKENCSANDRFVLEKLRAENFFPSSYISMDPFKLISLNRYLGTR